MSAIQTGNFASGFISGALSSITASAFGRWGGTFAKSLGGHALFGAISGGVGARLGNGNFWQGAVTGAVVAVFNHYVHSPKEEDNDDEEQQQGRKVTRESLGIKNGDDRETMISKTLKGMKVRDYMTGDDASFLGSASKDYVKIVTRTQAGFKIDGRSSWGISVFKEGATATIKPVVIKPSSVTTNINSYKISINGLTGAAVNIANVPQTSYISGNITRSFEGGKWYTVK